MRAVVLIALTVVCPASILKSAAPVNELSSDGAVNDNAVFAAEKAMMHNLAWKSTSAATKVPMAVTGNITANSVSTSGGASSVSQPKAVSWQAQRSEVTKSVVDGRANLRASQHREGEAIVTHRAAAEESEAQSKAAQEKSFENASAHAIFAFDSELATKGELARYQNNPHEHTGNEQFAGDATRRNGC